MKRILLVLPMAIVAILLAVILVLLRFRLDTPPSIEGTTPQFLSENELSLLVTTEYTVKIVFPHDFLPAGTTPSVYRTLTRKAASGEPLTPEETANMEVYDFLDRMGHPFYLFPYDFIVVDLTVRAGYDFSDPTLPPLAAWWTEDGLLEVPPAAILSITMGDTPHTEDYPAIRLSASQWKETSSFIISHAPSILPVEEILEHATRSARRALGALFSGRRASSMLY